jgi:hypothetical protein
VNDLLDKLLDAFVELIESGERIPDELFDEVTQLILDEIETLNQSQAPVPPSAELLWILSGGKPDAFANYLKTVPDRTLNVLSTNPAKVRSMIEQLSKRVNLPAGQVEQGIPKSELQSSTIFGFQYDPKRLALRVKFQGDGVYEYEGVPPEIFKLFQKGAISAKTDGQNEYGKWWRGKNPSLGGSMYALIKMGGYPYHKVA